MNSFRGDQLSGGGMQGSERDVPSKLIVPSPSRSTSLMICSSSSAVGFWPEAFITRPNSSTVMFPPWSASYNFHKPRECRGKDAGEEDLHIDQIHASRSQSPLPKGIFPTTSTTLSLALILTHTPRHHEMQGASRHKIAYHICLDMKLNFGLGWNKWRR